MKILVWAETRPPVSRTLPRRIHTVMKVVMVMMSVKKSLQGFDDFMIWERRGRGIQTEHLGNHHAEIQQLKHGQKNGRHSLTHRFGLTGVTLNHPRLNMRIHKILQNSYICFYMFCFYTLAPQKKGSEGGKCENSRGEVNLEIVRK